jgi:hypothetical protein
MTKKFEIPALFPLPHGGPFGAFQKLDKVALEEFLPTVAIAPHFQTKN